MIVCISLAMATREERLENTVKFLQKEHCLLHANERAAFRTFNAMLRCSHAWNPKLHKHMKLIYDSMFKRTSNAVAHARKSNDKRAARNAELVREMCLEMDKLLLMVKNIEDRIAAIEQTDHRRTRNSDRLAQDTRELAKRAKDLQLRLARNE